MPESGARDINPVEIASVSTQDAIDDASLAVRFGFDYHGRTGIAEQHRYVPEAGVPFILFRSRWRVGRTVHIAVVCLRPRHETGMRFSPDQQNVFRHAGPDLSICQLQAENETGALLPDVKTGDVL